MVLIASISDGAFVHLRPAAGSNHCGLPYPYLIS